MRYYGPQGDFMQLGLFVSGHAGWSSLAFGRSAVGFTRYRRLEVVTEE